MHANNQIAGVIFATARRSERGAKSMRMGFIVRPR